MQRMGENGGRKRERERDGGKSHLEGERFIGVVREDMAAET